MPPFPFPDDTNPYHPDVNNGRANHNDALLPMNGADFERNDRDDIDVSPEKGERFDRARRSAWIVYFVLIAAGLVMGGITLFIIAWLMQHFGLTDVPGQVEPTRLSQ